LDKPYQFDMKLKRNLLFILIPTLFIFSCKKDGPLKKTTDTTTIISPSGVDVYAAGESYYNGNEVPTYWKNGVAVILNHENNLFSEVNSIAVSGKDVYVTGIRQTATFYNVAAYWKNGVEYDLTDSTVSSSAFGITVQGSDVYIAGSITLSSGKDGAVFWKNGVLTMLPCKDYATGKGITVNGSDVYVTGGANTDFSPLQGYAVYWKNGVENKFSVSGTDISSIASVAVHDNDVYATGLTITGGMYFAVYWKNGVTTSLNPYTGYNEAASYGIAFQGNDIYVVGNSIEDNNLYQATIWKNGVPTLLNGNFATAICIQGNDIYVSGGYGNSPAYWKNNNFVELPQQVGESNSANAITVVPN
jgi:hypothetical protein